MRRTITMLPILLIPFFIFSDSSKKTIPADRHVLSWDQSRNESQAEKLSVTADTPGGWVDIVQTSIAESEYDIRWHEESGLWSSPNRTQNLRFFYDGNGFQAAQRGNSEWSVSMHVAGYGKSEMRHLRCGRFMAEKNLGRSETGGMTITYENTPEGMRQNFIIRERPDGDGFLKIWITVITELSCLVNDDGNGVTFKDGRGSPKFSYAGLKVTDVHGHELRAGMKSDQHSLAIVIDDTDARYPILVDPLSTSANWAREGQQLNEYFAYFVSSAGDVNGDGYSDIMVAATHYDNDQTNEGRVFVYHGSPAGLDTISDWTQEGDQDEAYFGQVAPAGDVNGDGYSDVIVGCNYYDSGQTDEGKVFLYYGGPGGLSDTVNWTAESDQTDAFFGSGVACAGDVNGDGYSDVIVGSPSFDNGQVDEGRAFVYHGSSSGLSLVPNWITESGQPSARWGERVACAGDVNGDGYSDVILGVPHCDQTVADEGLAYAYYGSPTGLSPSANWYAIGNQAAALFGSSVASAGDVNGDGYSDVVVGAYSFDNGQPDEGRVFVYHGSAGGLSWSWDWVVESNQAGACLGNVVASAGDVNGDGYADVIAGACNYDNPQNDAGAAFVFHGSASGLRYTPGTFEPDWQAEGDQPNAVFGHDLAPAGDVNGDGFSDVIVGGIYYDASWNAYGRAFVYHGGSSGLSAAAKWTSESDQTNALLGFSVASAGDVNGDGYSDAIVGAPNYDNGQTDEGRAFVYHGGAGGLSVTADWTTESDQTGALYGYSVASASDVNADGYSDVVVGSYAFDNGQSDEGVVFVFHGGATGLSASADWTFESDQAGASLGFSVAPAGDLNGDGYSDVLVGAPLFDNGQNDEGRVFVYYGGASGLSLLPNWTSESDQVSAYFGKVVSTAGDVNGDGYSDVIVGSPNYDHGQLEEGRAFVYHGSMAGLSTTANWTGESNQVNALFGTSVSCAGDVNGDGYTDVIVGAHQYDNGQSDEGRAFVYYGSSAGLSASANWTAESDQSDACFGYSVASAGDVNGDGYSDAMVGAYLYDNGESNEGRVFVYYGGMAGPSVSATWSAESDQASAWFAGSLAAAGDVNGDGYSDVIVGSSQYDNSETDEGKVFVYYGNATGGLSLRPRQYRSDLVTPIAPLGRTYSNSQAAAGVFVRPFCGPIKVRVQYEVKPLGTPFTGTGFIQSAWTHSGTGLEMKQSFTGLTAKTNYKWRSRINYDLSYGFVQPYSRWIYPQGNGGLGEADFRATNIASEPTVQASAMNLVQHSEMGQHTIVTVWSSGNGSNHLVIASAAGPITGWPHDGVSYSADTVLGQGSEISPGQFVVYNGSGNSCSVTGVSIRHSYYLAVYEFNGSAGDENYLLGGITNADSLMLMNQPPALVHAISDTILTEDFGSTFIRSLSTVFADDTVLTFGVTALATGVLPDIENDSLFVTAQPDFAGMVPIRVTAFDGELTATDTFHVTVLSENDPPGASNFIAPTDHSRFLTNPTSTTLVLFSWNRSTDPDGQTVTYIILTDTILSFSMFLDQYRGTDTMFSLQNRQLDTLAMELGVTQGDSIELYWRVLSIAGLDTIPSSNTHQIRIVREIIVGIGDPVSKIPTRYSLHPNFPNPFNSSTTIRYDLAGDSQVLLRIYNLLGQEVRTLVTRPESAGYKSIVWDGKDNSGRSAASGVYLYRLRAAEFTMTRKLLLMK